MCDTNSTMKDSCIGAGVDNYLAQDFVEDIAVIRSLLRNNAVLNEICENYEEIAYGIAELKLEKGEAKENEMQDFVDTLNALRKEINQILIDPNNLRE